MPRTAGFATRLRTALISFALVLVATAGSARAAVAADLFLSASGSDSNACTQTAPCKSFDRVYRLAKPGQVVELASGTYGGQTIGIDSTKTSPDDVLFRPASGATVSAAYLHVYGSHIEIRNIRLTSWPGWRTWRSADDVTLRELTAPKFTILGSSHVSVIGGDYGPFDNGSNEIAPESPTDPKIPTAILLDGVKIHDYSRTDASSHVDCLHTWGVNGLVVRNSVFKNCEHFDILFTVDSIAGTPTNVTIENNFLDCCRSGYYSVYLGDETASYSNFLVRNNSSNKPMGIRAESSTVSNLRFYGNIAPRFEGCGRPGVTVDYNVWYAGSKCGTHDLVAPSGFQNVAALDFHLALGAAAIDRGSPANSPSLDIDGEARPAGLGPDAGADEFGGASAPTALDTTAPSMPPGLAKTGSTPTSVTIVWDASTDNAGVTSYNAYKGGALTATTDKSIRTYTFSGLTCGSSYSFAVGAVDAAGNKSANNSITTSTSACATTGLQAPNNLRATATAKTSIAVAWSSSPGASKYALFRNGSRVASVTKTNYTFVGLACGTLYALAVDARDGKGHVSPRGTLKASTSPCGTGATTLTSPTVSPPTPPSAVSTSTSPSSLFVATTGSDANPCTQSEPCKSFDRAYHVATSGQVVEIAGGSYPAQTITHDASKTALDDVVFRPAVGAVVTTGELQPRGARHLTFEGFAAEDYFVVPSGGSSGGARAEDITFRNMSAKFFFIRAGKDISLLGGSLGGTDFAVSNTIGSYPGLPVSENVVVDGVHFHDMTRATNPSGHMECLFIQESRGTTVRNSVFERCEVFDLRIDEILGGSVVGTVIEGNTFHKTAPTGYYALDLDEGDVNLTRNVFHQGVSVGDTSVGKITGCGNTLVGTGFSVSSSVTAPC